MFEPNDVKIALKRIVQWLEMGSASDRESQIESAQNCLENMRKLQQPVGGNDKVPSRSALSKTSLWPTEWDFGVIGHVENMLTAMKQHERELALEHGRKAVEALQRSRTT